MQRFNSPTMEIWQPHHCGAALSAWWWWIQQMKSPTIEIWQPHHCGAALAAWWWWIQRLNRPTIAIWQPHHSLQPLNSPTVVGLLNGYGGAVKSLLWGCSTVVFTTMQKDQPHRQGTKLYAQIANCLLEICITCFLKHIYSTLIGISDILKQHYFSTGVSL